MLGRRTWCPFNQFINCVVFPPSVICVGLKGLAQADSATKPWKSDLARNNITVPYAQTQRDLPSSPSFVTKLTAAYLRFPCALIWP